MRKFRPRRPSGAMLVATVALFVALGGSSYAVSQISGAQIKNGTIKSIDIGNSQVKGIDVGSNTLTGSDINESRLGTVPSATNATHANTASSADTATQATNATNANLFGNALPSAYQGRVRWALVSSAGAILEQSGGITITSQAGGFYFLDFGENLTNHGLMATLVDTPSGEVTATRCGGANGFGACSGFTDANHVLVRTKDSAGAGLAKPFYLAELP